MLGRLLNHATSYFEELGEARRTRKYTVRDSLSELVSWDPGSRSAPLGRLASLNAVSG